MRRLLRKTVAALLAVLLLLFSLMGSAVSAAELEDENGEAALAESGAGTPVITSLQCRQEGVRIEWQTISGVDHYRVDKWYTDGRGWQKLTDTTRLYCIDEAVVSGNVYRYRLYGVNAAGGVMTTTTVRQVTYSAPAVVNDAQTMTDGIRIYWNKDAGVSKVAVLRKENNTWKQIAVSADSSYLDKNVSYGKQYTYTVRAMTDSGEYMHDYYDEVGLTHSYLKTPALKVENAAGGVMLRWDAIEGADAYRVFYRNNGTWKRMAVTEDNYLLDTDVRSGNSYTYTVRCITADGERYTSYCDTAGKGIRYIAAPVLLSADSTDDGIRISWQASPGADKYRIFYRGRNGWTRMADTTETSYVDTDVSSGSSYTYTVICLNAADEHISSYYSEGIRGMFLNAPEFSVSNGADGIDISWPAVQGAEKYRIYYYGSRGWTSMVDTTSNSYTDTDVESGKNYTYTVRCINDAGTDFTSGYLPGKSVAYYAAPTITSLTNTEDGVRISWDAVGGAQKYRVYYRGRNGWTRMADTADTSYVDTDVASGTTYTYTVRCINNAGDTFMSWFKPGVSHTFIAAPDFDLECNEKSISISWDAVEGAELYRVYYRGSNGWTKLADTTQTSFEDDDIESGYNYTYTVRCLNKEATAFTSDFYAGRSIRYVEMPRLTSVRGGAEGVEINWNACKGASKYRVYYRSENGWTRAGETTSNSFVHKAESGRDYTYTVRCVNAEGTRFESTFDRTGKSLHYIAAPQDLSAECYNDSIKISWTPSAGAAKYRVYYYGGDGWTRLTETTGTSVIDDDVASGYTYRYTVRCISADGNSFTSDYNHDGALCPFNVMPVLYEPDFTKNGIEISWKASPGAEKYRVYYYGSRGWTKLTETTGTSVIDTDVASGYTYRYTVRCINSDGTAFTSDCDTTGVSVYYVDAPKLIDAEVDSDSVTLTWNSPSGASRYRVYKRINGSWSRLGDTSSNSYTDTDVSAGNTYTYTVRVINYAGTAFYSGFDPSGFVIAVDGGSSSTDGFYYYDQTDYNYPYGDDTIAWSGCGPTCFAMVASTLKGRRITPIDAVKWCGNEHYMMGVGTYWSYFPAAADHFGIDLEQQLGAYETNAVISALRQGKYVISAQKPGIFTRAGHFIVLAGITSSGRIIVYDPNGGNNYIGTTFTMSEISASGTQYWVFDN